jgi:AraC family transcriptional regulator
LLLIFSIGIKERGIKKMEPKFVDLDSIQLVGLPFYGDPAEGRFGKAWDRFIQYDKSITNKVNGNISYGLEVYGPEFFQLHQWTYFPSVAVNNLEQIPEGLFGKILPVARYVVFTAVGKLAKIGEMFQFAYMDWIPASSYEVAHPFDFELYDERFHGDVPESMVDIYIPIKPK